MKKYLPILALITASLIWGAASPVFKWSIQNIPIFPLVFVRFFVASIFLIPFLKSTKIEKKDLFQFILLGLSGITINVAFFFLGISLTSAINGGVMAVSAPIFTILASRLFLKEKQSLNLILGSLIGLLGVLLIIGQSIFVKGFSVDLLGNLYLILAVWGLVGHEILVRKLKNYDPILITYVMFLVGALTFEPLAFWQLWQNPNFLLTIDIRGYTGLTYGIFLSSLIAYFLWNWGLTKFSASRAGVFLYADPLAAVLVAFFLLGEKITLLTIFGTLLIFVGIYVAERRIHYLHQPFFSKFAKRAETT